MDISSALSAGSFPLDDRNEPVYLERDGHTAAIVLNRPDKLNAITRHMWMRLYQAITSLSADTSLRCIVLRSTSPKAFPRAATSMNFLSAVQTRHRHVNMVN